MAFVILPIENVTEDFQFRTSLEDSSFIFRFTWNKRTENFIMNILDTDENELAVGIEIQSGILPLEQYKNDELPLGDLFAVNFKNNSEKASLENFGKDFLIIYRESFT